MKSRNFSLPHFLGPRINQVGFQNCPPCHEYGGVRDHVLFHFIAYGRGEFQNQNGRWNLNEGQGFFIFPGDRHRYRADATKPWHYRWIGFDLEGWDPFGPIGLSPKNPILRLEKDEVRALEQIVDQTLEISNPLAPTSLLHLQVCTWSFLRVLSNTLSQGPTLDTPEKWNLGSSPQDHARTMQSFMTRHFSSPIGVHEVVDHAHLERSYGSRVFRKFAGKSIGAYLLTLRMDAAVSFLRQGLRAKEIGYSVGYKDYEVFLRAFKKYWGTTTTRFRLPGETP